MTLSAEKKYTDTRDEIASTMTAVQVAEAKRLANALRPFVASSRGRKAF
jgi:hypothetical protein